jgi:hypothetical protein
MRINVTSNLPDLQRWVGTVAQGVNRATREALNRTAEWAETDVRREMRKVFDRPLPFTLRSLKIGYAKTGPNPTATLWFKQRRKEEDKLWAKAQIFGGDRQLKPMELRMQRVGILPQGWFVVPGAAAPLDAFGNMSRGEITRILNVLGTYTEAGFNKANQKTRDRLRKGNEKKGQYGFAYWVNPVSGPRNRKHLLPGVYRRVYTPFGTSLKPMMIFVRKATYKPRLDFFGVVNATVERRFPSEFTKAMDSLVATGSASGARRGLSG